MIMYNAKGKKELLQKMWIILANQTYYAFTQFAHRKYGIPRNVRKSSKISSILTIWEKVEHDSLFLSTSATTEKVY